MWIRYLSQIYLRNSFCNFAKISVFQQGVSTVYSDNRMFYQSKKITESSKSLTIEFWQSLTSQNSHWADLTNWNLCNAPTKWFISWVFLTEPTSILSDIVISLRKSNEIIFVTDFFKTKNTCERSFWDVSETSWKRHIFWDMPETS